MITVACPHCDSELKGPDTFRGKRVRCKKCGEPFTIPTDDDVIEAVEVVGDDEVEVVDDVEVVESKPKPKPRVPVVKKPVRKAVEELDEVEEVEDDEEERRPTKKKKTGKVVKSGAAKVMIRLGLLMIVLGIVGMVVVGMRGAGDGGVVRGGGDVVQGGGGGNNRNKPNADRGEPGDPEDQGNIPDLFLGEHHGALILKEGKIIATLSNPRRTKSERGGRDLILIDFTCVDGRFLGEGTVRVRTESGKVGSIEFHAVKKRKGTLPIMADEFFLKGIDGKVTVDILRMPDWRQHGNYESVTASIEVPAK